MNSLLSNDTRTPLTKVIFAVCKATDIAPLALNRRPDISVNKIYMGNQLFSYNVTIIYDNTLET